MKTILVLLFALIALLSVIKAEEGEAVLTLTTANFDDTVNAADIIVVEFYAPWCGHCKHLAPEYEAAAKILKTSSPPVILAKVDATEERELGDRFGVRGYPTLKIFRKGKVSDYNGPREAKGIVKYMENQSGPATRVLTSAEDVAAFKKKDDVVVIGFFSNTNDKTLTSFRDTASGLRDDFSFAEVTAAALVKQSNHENKVVIVRSDEKEIEWDGKTDMASFIKANSIPVGGELTQENMKRYQEANVPIVKVFIPVDWGTNAKRTNYYKRRLQKAGEGFEGRLLFALAEKKDFLHDPASYGIKPDSTSEFVMVIEEPSTKKFVYPDGQAFSVESVKQFVNDYLGGKLTPYMKSEPIPEDNSGPVKVVVGKTFDQIVLDPTKNVLIEFYAPWCGHCKTLAPKYEELGSKFGDKSNVVIAKIDATANDWSMRDTFDVKGFPTIYFKPAGANPNIVKYEGSREVKDMKKYVKDNSVKA